MIWTSLKLFQTFNIWLRRCNYFVLQYEYFQTLQLSSSVAELQIFFSASAPTPAPTCTFFAAIGFLFYSQIVLLHTLNNYLL
jgi:hypothetical protein